MILKIYAVFDSKAGNYAQPNFLHSDGIAHRAFSDLVNNPKSAINKHPADYSMWCIGSWDDDSAQFESQKPVQIVQGATVYIAVDRGPALPGMSEIVDGSAKSLVGGGLGAENGNKG